MPIARSFFYAYRTIVMWLFSW